MLQINRALDYIEDNLAAPPTIEQIAQSAGISKWYFQRIFQAMVGDTVKNYSQRRRLTLAAKALLKSREGILDIALKHGFDSHEVFTRAFKRTFNMTPSAFRQHPPPLNTLPFKPRITKQYLNHLYAGVSLQPEVVDFPLQTLVGFSVIVRSIEDDFQGNQAIIKDLWQRLTLETERIEGEGIDQKVGMISDCSESPSALRLEYFGGYIWRSSRAEPSGFQTTRIPRGQYAKFTHHGPMSDLPQTYNYIYGSWFEKTDRKRGDGPEFSFLPTLFEPRSNDLELSIFIPLVEK